MTLRPAPAELGPILASSHHAQVRVESWLGGQLLTPEPIPLLAGDLDDQADQRVRETVTLAVPLVDRLGRSWQPTGPTSPLAAYGQRLRLTYLVVTPTGQALACPLGWYQVDEWARAGGAIEVTAKGLLALADEDKLTAPTSPPAGATLASELARLAPRELGVAIDAALTNRAAPQSMSWQDDRLAALHELAAAWPAELTVDSSGQLVAEPTRTAADPAELTLAEWQGTVTESKDSGGRAGIVNVWVVRGEDSDTSGRPAVQAIVEDTDPASPTYARGPYGRVVRHFSSPLLKTASACQAAGVTLLRKSLRAARTIPVQALPDPRVTSGTRLDLVRDDGTTVPTVVAGVKLPLSADGGAMDLTLEVLT